MLVVANCNLSSTLVDSETSVKRSHWTCVFTKLLCVLRLKSKARPRDSLEVPTGLHVAQIVLQRAVELKAGRCGLDPHGASRESCRSDRGTEEHGEGLSDAELHINILLQTVCATLQLPVDLPQFLLRHRINRSNSEKRDEKQWLTGLFLLHSSKLCENIMHSINSFGLELTHIQGYNLFFSLHLKEQLYTV